MGGAGLRFDGVGDVGNAAGEDAVGVGLGPDRHLRGGGQAAQVRLVHVGEHPHRRDVGDRQQIAIRSDQVADRDAVLRHDAVERGAQDVERRLAVPLRRLLQRAGAAARRHLRQILVGQSEAVDTLFDAGHLGLCAQHTGLRLIQL